MTALFLPEDDPQLAWQVDGLCAQTDPEAFFPEKGGSTKGAKLVCAECPVATECLQYALDNDERYGVWGGKSERERRLLRRSRTAGLARNVHYTDARMRSVPPPISDVPQPEDTPDLTHPLDLEVPVLDVSPAQLATALEGSPSPARKRRQKRRLTPAKRALLAPSTVAPARRVVPQSVEEVIADLLDQGYSPEFARRKAAHLL